MNENEKKLEEELGRVIILLDQYFDPKRSRMLGKFYKTYVNEQINWERFLELSEANNRVFISDIELLLKAYRGNGIYMANEELYEIDRLISIGLLQRNPLSNIRDFNSTRGTVNNEKDILITSFGSLFVRLITI